MNIGNRIKQSPVKGMRDTIWAEGSKAVNDEPWNYARHFLIISLRISVIDANSLIRFL